MTVSLSLSPASARAVPVSRWRKAVVERGLRSAVGRLPLRVRFGSGRAVGLGGPLVEVRDAPAFFRRVGAGGFVGIGESYIAGEWEAQDLVGVLTVLAEHAGGPMPASIRRILRSAPQDAGHLRPPGEEFVARYLDETLSHSGALFRALPAQRPLLAAAQHRKIDRLLDLAEVGPGTQLLEIGAGSGETAIRAGRRGARVLTVAGSLEELALARGRVAAAGLEGRVTVLLRDYRRVLGSYDAIVSVEAVQAVDAEFVMTLDRLLAPGGRIALQTVTAAHDRLPVVRTASAWIHKHAVPGGPPPAAQEIAQLVASRTGLRIAARDSFGAHYAETVRLWREQFEHVPADDRLRRTWGFYLACSEAGFRSGCVDVEQLLLTGP
ncbi:class I SAM-dependent methyltransferase [Streptomyces sp. NPDC051907]|uniref:class I SAM-dependent methyltransferase n=1 Tax=Streptomyces sp. NPDC051907 TaxID=3155284 RepID=UPI00342CA59C